MIAPTEEVFNDILSRLEQYVPGQFTFADSSSDTHYRIGVGRGVAVVAWERLQQIDDALIREMATQIMGYAPDSEPDLRRRAVEACNQIESIKVQIERLNLELRHWEAVNMEVLRKAIAIGMDRSTLGELVESEA